MAATAEERQSAPARYRVVGARGIGEGGGGGEGEEAHPGAGALASKACQGHMDLLGDSDDDGEDPPVADAYTEGKSSTVDRKAKGATRNGDFLRRSPFN